MPSSIKCTVTVIVNATPNIGLSCDPAGTLAAIAALAANSDACGNCRPVNRSNSPHRVIVVFAEKIADAVGHVHLTGVGRDNGPGGASRTHGQFPPGIKRAIAAFQARRRRR